MLFVELFFSLFTSFRPPFSVAGSPIGGYTNEQMMSYGGSPSRGGGSNGGGVSSSELSARTMLDAEHMARLQQQALQQQQHQLNLQQKDMTHPAASSHYSDRYTSQPPTGERVGFIHSSDPQNQWNHMAYPWRGHFFNSFFGLSYLFFGGLLIMAIIELAQSDFDHYLSERNWWWITLAFMITAFLNLVSTVFLFTKKAPIGEKQNQNFPPPPQDWRVNTLGFLLSAATFAMAAYLDSLSNPTPIRYTNLFRNVSIGVLLSTFTFLMSLIITIRMPISMPKAI